MIPYTEMLTFVSDFVSTISGTEWRLRYLLEQLEK